MRPVEIELVTGTIRSLHSQGQNLSFKNDNSFEAFFRKFEFLANLDQDEKHEIVRFAGSRAAGNIGFEARAAFFANSNQIQFN